MKYDEWKGLIKHKVYKGDYIYFRGGVKWK